MNTVSIPVESDAYKALSEIIRIKQKVGSAPATIGGKRISNEALIEIIKDKYRLDVADDSLVRKIYFSACDHSNTNKHMFFG